MKTETGAFVGVDAPAPRAEGFPNTDVELPSADGEPNTLFGVDHDGPTGDGCPNSDFEPSGGLVGFTENTGAFGPNALCGGGFVGL